MKSIGHHEDVDRHFKEESDEQIHDNDSNNEANSKNQGDGEDFVIEEEDVVAFVDEDYGKVDMAELFQNADDNPIEYIYTRDSTGRVVSVDFRLKVPRNEIDFIRNHNENGGIADVECRFKKTAGRKG